jgi:hypothetical protein
MARVDPYLVTKTVVALLREELTIPVGNGQLPSEQSSTGAYLVVNFIPPMDSLNASYGLSKGAMKRLRYQLTAVGLQADQAERVASLAVGVLVDDEDGSYVHNIDVPGHIVMDRAEGNSIPTDRVDKTVNAGYYVDLTVQATA